MLKSRWTKVALALGVIVIVVVAIAATALIREMNKMTKALNEMVIGDIDVSTLADGEYKGTCDVGIVAADVRVKIAGGRILSIDILRHDNGRGSAAESIVDRVTEAQSLAVDYVSGATASSKVILKAIEDALTV